MGYQFGNAAESPFGLDWLNQPRCIIGEKKVYTESGLQAEKTHRIRKAKSDDLIENKGIFNIFYEGITKKYRCQQF